MAQFLKRAKLTRKPKLFGLPEGFTTRLQQSAKKNLIEDNVYTLPGGQEFVAKQPTGTLGCRHLYALVTLEQIQEGRRGSVYVRADGRIFDYSLDHADLSRDMFDTGYSIYDLERTGAYAPNTGSMRIRSEDLKPRKVGQKRSVG